MHRKYRNTNIDNVKVEVGDILSNSSAAACIDFTKLACLPDYAVLIEESSDPAYKFSRSIRCAGLASCTCELSCYYALVQLRAVAYLERLDECGVNSSINVSGKALGFAHYISAVCTVYFSKIADKIGQI